MKKIGLIFILITLFSSVAWAEDSIDKKTKKQAVELMQEALNSSVGYDVVKSLTTEIGPRLAGSEAEARARDWGVNKFKFLGFKNVRVEPFDVEYWERHAEKVDIVSPFPQSLTVTALGYSVATPPEGISGKVVRFSTFQALKDAPIKSLKGKIAFVDEPMTRTQDGSGYGVAYQIRSFAPSEAAKRGAIATLIRSVGTDHHRMPHTGRLQYQDDAPKIPAAALSAPDADQLKRALDLSKNVVVNITLRVASLGNRESGNVIAEIPGETDEIVVIGAHLDSWDLGTGAIDDGAGIGITVGAAKLILDMKKKPKRTIRIVMFGSEEVGLVGAKAYAEKHKDELDKHIVGTESDFGAGKIYQLQTRFAENKLNKAAEIHKVLAPLGISLGNNTASGGPDMKHIRIAGVPVVTLKQNGWDYFDLHHTADDTLDKINPEDMAQNVAAYAAFVWMVANMEGDFR